MLNPLINGENQNEILNKDKSNDAYCDCTWCIFFNFDFLFICCSE